MALGRKKTHNMALCRRDIGHERRKIICGGQNRNIARGTTDPEIDSVTWTKFSDHKAWSADSTTCISYKFGHQMAPLALVTNLATRWQKLHVIL